ncbi:hypothetical protein SNEBB_006558 [Seison nebaliae]|nr:hypothetical protein SNEBB_006558 [Seison nebaliae]
MTYPKASTLVNDIVHTLPDVLVIPPIKKEIFAANSFHEIKLTTLEAKDLAEAQVNLFNELNGPSSLFFIAMISYKRALHIATVSFGTKILIQLLSMNATLQKYPDILIEHEFNETIENYMECFEHMINSISECYEGFKIGFNPEYVDLNNFSQIPQEELNYIFSEFIHIDSTQVPDIYYCSFAANGLLFLYQDLMTEVFYPMATILYNNLDKPPMELFKMVNIKMLLTITDMYKNSSYYDIILKIVNEYRFLHSYQTKDNPSLYYLVMRRLNLFYVFDNYNIDHAIHCLSDYVKGVIDEDMNEIYNTHDMTNKVLKQYKELHLDYKTVFSLVSSDQIEPLYIEYIPTEVDVLTHLLNPLNIFTVKMKIICAMEKSEVFDTVQMMEEINKDGFLRSLFNMPISLGQFGGTLQNRGNDIYLPLNSIPISHAIKRYRRPSISKAGSYTYPNITHVHSPEQRQKLERNEIDVSRLSSPLRRKLLKKYRHGLIPKKKSHPTSINPIIYWPLFPNEMVNKYGDTYDIFHFHRTYEKILKMEETYNNELRYVKYSCPKQTDDYHSDGKVPTLNITTTVGTFSKRIGDRSHLRNIPIFNTTTTESGESTFRKMEQ